MWRLSPNSLSSGVAGGKREGAESAGNLGKFLDPWLRPWLSQVVDARQGILVALGLSVLLWDGCAVACVQSTCTVLGGP